MNKEIYRNAVAARQASYVLAATGGRERSEALLRIAEGLERGKSTIFEANDQDVEAAQKGGLSQQIIKRLKFDEAKLADVTSGIRDLAFMPDPIHQVTLHTEMADGLTLRRVSCPIGVIGVIFESRPDALVQIASLCLKSGNAALLKGGIEASRTNQALFDIILDESLSEGMPQGWIALLRSREEVSAMLEMDEQIDLIIPRGSNSFVRYIMDNTRIPVLGHSSGICHLYLDASAEPEMAAKLAVDSKVQYPAACNSAETLVVHVQAADALRTAGRALVAQGVSLKADHAARRILREAGVEADTLTEEDYGTEYGDLVMNVMMVNSLEEAIGHINQYGSHHTDCIVTDSRENADKFIALVDSAGVYHNCSTRFADGYRYGFGAEVGISTGKIHARGPMGVEGLCSYKYVIEGTGDCVADFASGNRTFTHKNLMEAGGKQ